MRRGLLYTTLCSLSALLIACQPFDGAGMLKVKVEGKGYVFFKDGDGFNGVALRDGRYILCARDSGTLDLGENASVTGGLEPAGVYSEEIATIDAVKACEMGQEWVNEVIGRSVN